MEEVFGRTGIDVSNAPWELGWQMNERNIQWMDAFKTNLIKRLAAEEMGIKDEEFDERMNILMDLLPGMGPRLAKMPPNVIAELMRNIDSLANTLLDLKTIFPKADAAALLVSKPEFASMSSLESVAEAADELRQTLPNSEIDLLVSKYPVLLDTDQVRDFKHQVELLMPGKDFENLLHNNPSFIFSLQKGKNMIPYDEVPTGSSR